MIKYLGQKWVQFKYKYYELNIVQNIASDKFSEILQNYQSQGWEITGTYQSFDSVVNADISAWDCKLRKGQSILKCTWDDCTKGSIVGPQRIVVALGREFDLDAHQSPVYPN